MASVCQPVALAVGQSTPSGLTVDASSVYWTTEDGKILAAPIAGGSATVLASGQKFPRGIAVDSTHVYWVNAASPGQVMSVPIGGGTPTVLADLQRRPFRLAVRDGMVYWTNNDNGTIMKMPVSGGSPTQLADTQATPVGIAVDANTLYWSSIGQGAIRSLPLVAGGTVATIASHQDAVALFVLDSTIYWANVKIADGGSSVFRLSSGAGAPEEMARSSAAFAAVADRANIYWTDDNSYVVMKTPVGGGPATVVAANQPSPTEIAIDQSNIYWVNAITDGAIMKLAK